MPTGRRLSLAGVSTHLRQVIQFSSLNDPHVVMEP
jgi:hypothetical protein